MSAISRRQLLQNLIGGLLGTAGTVVLAGAALGTTEAEAAAPPAESVQERADRVAEELGPVPEDEGEFTSFVNGGFRNGGGGGGGFRKGGFANGGGGGGGFRKGGFANGGGGGGGFRKGGFANGGGGGGFRNY